MEKRTDLAVEARELVGEDIQGVEFEERRQSGLEISRLRIKNHKASVKLKKEEGSYVTVDIPAMTDNFPVNDDRVEVIGSEIRRLIPVNGLVLVCGLGNTEITPDALGPKSASRVLATRHITGELARSTGLDNLRPVAVLNTGVTGQTGIETFEYIESIVKTIKPGAVLVIDALASRRVARLGTTIQITDTGVSPGAGVNNHRRRISQKTLGVPVIAVGVPTVVDSLTLVSDLLRIDDEKTAEQLKSILSPRGSTMVVTPKEIDLLIDRASRIISLSINKALQSSVDIADIEALM
ncbi:MAG: GPR endopeptidase [Ruminococcus sp.]|jgi:spore protease|nr:GPR endopeptidase [Ruminococcus sp.]